MTKSIPFGVFRWPAFAVAAALLPLGLIAQPATADDDEDDDELYILSPFEVDASRDTGYSATNAISATRLSTAIRDIPLSLEVVTNEFMRDTGATNLREALRYSAGVVLESQYDGLQGAPGGPADAGANLPEGQTRNPSGSTFKIRGMLTEQSLRDGFRRQHATDWVNMERVEVLRGPSALLYGVGNLGGVVNYIAKRPMAHERYYGQFTIGTNEFYRAEFDYSTPFGDDTSGRNGFRVTGALQRTGDYTDWYKRKQLFISPIITWSPTENTFITFDNEYGRQREEGIGFLSVRAWLNDTEGGAGSGAQQRRQDFIVPAGRDARTFRWSGPDTYRNQETSNHLLNVDHKVADNFWLRGGIQYSRRSQDGENISSGQINAVDGTRFSPSWYRAPQTAAEQEFLDNLMLYNPSGATLSVENAYRQGAGAARNFLLGVIGGDPSLTPEEAEAQGWPTFPNLVQRPANMWLGDVLGAAPLEGFSRLPSSGEGTSSADHVLMSYRWGAEDWTEDRWQARFDANYDFEVAGINNSVIFGYQGMKTDRGFTNFGVHVPNLPPGPAGAILTNNYAGIAQPEYLRREFQPDGRPTIPLTRTSIGQNKSTDHGFYGLLQSRLFDDRLTLIGGLRYDRSSAENIDENLINNTFSRTSTEATTAWSPQIGASFRVTDNVSVFGVYSTGVTPNYFALDGHGNRFSPTKATNKEVGVKFDMFENRVSGTVSFFRVDRTNIARDIWWAPSPGIPAGRKGRIANWDPNARQTMYITGFDPMTGWQVRDLPGTADPNGGIPALANFFGGIPADPADPRRPLGTAGMDMGGIQPWSWVEHPDLPDGQGFAGALWNIHGWSIGEGDWWQWWNTWGAWANVLVDLDNPAMYEFISTGIRLMAEGELGWFSWIYEGNGAARNFADGTTGIVNAYGNEFGGAAIPYSDQSKGFEVQLIANPTPNWRMTFGYSRLDNEVTNDRYEFIGVDLDTRFAELGIWAFPSGDWGTMGLPVDEFYEDPTDTSTGIVRPIEAGGPIDDSPKHTVSFWNRYAFDNIPELRGAAVGFGGTWQSERLYQAGVTPDGTGIGQRDEDGRFIIDRLFTPTRFTLNALLEYNFRMRDRYDVRMALNVDNVLNDKKQYGFLYAPGRSARLATSITF